MSFFNQYIPPEEDATKNKSDSAPEFEYIPPEMILIDGANFIKEVADNPTIKEGKVDIGNGVGRIWTAFNYNPSLDDGINKSTE